MTDTAPAKKKRIVNRTVKPVYAIVSYTQDGEAVRLNKSDLQITVEKDMDKIVELLSEGNGTGVVVKLDMPQPKPRGGASA